MSTITMLALALLVAAALWGALFVKIDRDVKAPRPVKGYTYTTSWDGSVTRVDPFTGRMVTRDEDTRYGVDPFVDGFKAASEVNSDW